MTIRARLTLWYAVIFFASMLVMLGLSYKHFVDEQQPDKRSLALSEFLKREAEDWDDAATMVLWFGIPAALLGVAGGWFLMRKALAPIAELSAATEKVTERNLRESIPRSGNGDELDRLTDTFNRMTTRLDVSFQRIREFTLHASHELKTPLTVMRGEWETALRDETVSTAQRERILSQLEEIDRLTRIVDGLTLLTKADAGQVQLKLETLQLDELLRDAVEDARILAQPSNISVCLDKCEPVTIRGDRDRLRQLLLNLNDNAVKYNRPNGTVTISLARLGDRAEIRITNTGQGISNEMLPRIFDRFFRGDQSHSNAVDGCGLGLSICKWIVSAHAGNIAMTSTPETSTSVIVELPVATKI